MGTQKAVSDWWNFELRVPTSSTDPQETPATSDVSQRPDTRVLPTSRMPERQNRSKGHEEQVSVMVPLAKPCPGYA